MGPSSHLSFCACKTAWFAQEYKDYMGCSPHLWFCASNTVWLAPEALVSMGSNGLCMQKRDFWARITNLYGSELSHVVLCMKRVTSGAELQLSVGSSPHLWFSYAKQRLVDQHTSLYGYQTSPVVLCIQTSAISTRNIGLYGFLPSSVVLCMKTATWGPDLQVCMCPRPQLSFSACKTAWIASEILVSMGPSTHL